MQKIQWSKWMLLLLMLICSWYGKNLDTWGHNKVIQNDVVSYYAYLPAALIFHDLNFEFTRELPADFEGTIWTHTAPNGKAYLKMTMGLSILWIPFFLMAHLFATVSGIQALGYSWPYSLSIFVAALFYLFAGLFFLRKILLRYFSEPVAALTLLVVVLATNLMYYVISEPGMSHVYNFALITGFLFYSLKWTDHPVPEKIILPALLAGIIVLIRPVNLLILIFPALLGISTMQDLYKRFTAHWKSILAAGILAFLVLLPQMIYWKVQTGHYLFNSYGEEGFYFLEPQILNGLFSYRKGWFVYTPVMLFAVGGMFFLRKKAPGMLLPMLVFIPVNIYVVYSWWCWWYGGSFGSRPMIDMYGVMALPLAAVIDKGWKGKNIVRLVLSALLAGFIWLNLFQMEQYRISLLHWDSMTKEAYWGIFGEKQWPQGYDQMISSPDYEKALKGEKEY